MAPAPLPEPGTQYGPCVEPCGHLDCGETRAQAATRCAVCQQPIGYGNPFYQSDAYAVLYHDACLPDPTDPREREEAALVEAKIEAARATAREARSVLAANGQDEPHVSTVRATADYLRVAREAGPPGYPSEPGFHKPLGRMP